MKRRTFLHLAFPPAAAAVLGERTCWAGGTTAGSTDRLPVYADGSARLNALLRTGVHVAVADGTYLISEPLDVQDGQVVLAAPGAVPMLRAASGYSGAIIDARDRSFAVRGLVLDGSCRSRLALEGDSAAALVRVVGGRNVTFENNIFLDAPSFAIWAWKSGQLQVRGNRFVECWQPIRVDAAGLPAGAIDNNTMVNTAARGSVQHIEAIGTVDLAVRGNIMEGAGLAEPKRHGPEGTWGNSIYMVSSTGYLVEANVVRQNRWSSLVSGEGTTWGTISANQLSDGIDSATAVWIEQPGAAHITVDRNQIDGGISMGDEGGDNIIVTGNVIRSRGVGLDVSSEARNVLIQGNRISSKAGLQKESGIYLWQKDTPDTNVRVFDNVIEGFDKGVAINNHQARGSVYGVHLKGNAFSGNNTDVWIPPSLVLDGPLHR